MKKKKSMGVREMNRYMKKNYADRTFLVAVEYWSRPLENPKPYLKLSLFRKDWTASCRKENPVSLFCGKTWEDIINKLSEAEGND